MCILKLTGVHLSCTHEKGQLVSHSCPLDEDREQVCCIHSHVPESIRVSDTKEMLNQYLILSFIYSFKNIESLPCARHYVRQCIHRAVI